MFTQESKQAIPTLMKYLQDLDISCDTVSDQELLLTAFIHKSYASDFTRSLVHNERLEFLGDGILWAIVNKLLFIQFAHMQESQLTLLKIGLVREETLADVAREIHLGKYIFLGKGEKKQKGEKKDSILSDTLEALLWFLYIDKGEWSVERFIVKYIFPKLKEVAQRKGKSYKSLVQEFVQKKYKTLPVYQTIEHDLAASGIAETYKTSLYINERKVSEGIAKNKKKSQEAAAKQAYETNALH